MTYTNAHTHTHTHTHTDYCFFIPDTHTHWLLLFHTRHYIRQKSTRQSYQRLFWKKSEILVTTINLPNLCQYLVLHWKGLMNLLSNFSSSTKQRRLTFQIAYKNISTASYVLCRKHIHPLRLVMYTVQYLYPNQPYALIHGKCVKICMLFCY